MNDAVKAAPRSCPFYHDYCMTWWQEQQRESAGIEYSSYRWCCCSFLHGHIFQWYAIHTTLCDTHNTFYTVYACTCSEARPWSWKAPLCDDHNMHTCTSTRDVSNYPRLLLWTMTWLLQSLCERFLVHAINGCQDNATDTQQTLLINTMSKKNNKTK